MFQRDYDYFYNKLKAHKRIGFFKKLISFGFWNDDIKIKECEEHCENILIDINRAKKFLAEASRLDNIEDIVIIEGIRVCKNTFSDLPTIGTLSYPSDWEQLRESILERDNYECQEADGYCRGPLQIHHRIPLSQGGNNNESNLSTLCIFHHSMKHSHL